MGRPNILFLLSDEHSHRFMGHRAREDGGEDVETPTFDKLAGEGTVFTDAYCQMPLCTPSRLSLLSGREVRGAGAWNNNSVMRPDLATLPGTLADAGYETCLVGKMHLGGSRQYVGFQHRPYGDLTGGTGHQADPIADPAARGMRGRTSTAVGVTEIPESLLQEQVVAQETVAWVREHEAANPDKPWFLMASFSRPHFPLTAPRRWIDRYAAGEITEPMAPAAGDAYDHPMSVGMRRGFQTDEIDHDEMMTARAAYFACVSYLDELLGDLLTRLDAGGQLDNTVIVYTSDHGEMAGEHGTWWKNGWYEACARVPLLVSTPAQRASADSPREVSTPVGIVDLYPTLCAMAGAAAPDDLDGRDLSGAVDGEPLEDRPVFCDGLTPRWGDGTEFRMARWKQYKCVRFREAPQLMFNLDDDPLEQRNLIERGATGEAAKALAYLGGVLDRTMDFSAAEAERRRDARLSETFQLDARGSAGNLYHMPAGHIVNAEDALYAPTRIADQPDDIFADYPGE